jgi:hypothetical protein
MLSAANNPIIMSAPYRLFSQVTRKVVIAAPGFRLCQQLLDFHENNRTKSTYKTPIQENNCLKLPRMLNQHWCWKNEHLNID